MFEFTDKKTPTHLCTQSLRKKLSKRSVTFPAQSDILSLTLHPFFKLNQLTMALTALTPLTYAQYRALTITPFTSTPGRTSTGNPNNKVGMQLSGWVGTDLLAFMVNEAASTDSSLTIDSVNSFTLDVDVLADSDPNSEITYWTVNMGAGASGTNWQLSFQVDDGNADTGTWTFTKGKGDDDGGKY